MKIVSMELKLRSCNAKLSPLPDHRLLYSSINDMGCGSSTSVIEVPVGSKILDSSVTSLPQTDCPVNIEEGPLTLGSGSLGLLQLGSEGRPRSIEPADSKVADVKRAKFVKQSETSSVTANTVLIVATVPASKVVVAPKVTSAPSISIEKGTTIFLSFCNGDKDSFLANDEQLESFRNPASSDTRPNDIDLSLLLHFDKISRIIFDDILGDDSPVTVSEYQIATRDLAATNGNVHVHVLDKNFV